jgi:hypothetical protein
MNNNKLKQQTKQQQQQTNKTTTTTNNNNTHVAAPGLGTMYVEVLTTCHDDRDKNVGRA